MRKLSYMILDYFLGDTCLYLLGEYLGNYQKIETLKGLNIYISAYQAINRSYMKLCDTYLEVPLIIMRK